MKIFLYVLLPIILLGNQLLFSQQDYIIVLATQGEISVQKNGIKQWNRAKTGDKLFLGYRLRIGNNSYAAIANSKGLCTDISQKGIYNINEIKDLIRRNYKTSNDKFAHFLIVLLKKVEEEANEMKSWAGVVRVKPHNIMIGVPSSSMIIDSSVIFKWFPYPGTDNYAFKLINSNDVTLYMKVLKDTSLNVNLNLFDLNKNENYKWMVSDYSKPEISSDTNYVMIPDPATENAIRDSINLLNSMQASDTSAINLIVYAKFYDNSKLNFKAFSEYSKAIHLAPNVEIYKKMFAEFLSRMNMIYKY